MTKTKLYLLPLLVVVPCLLGWSARAELERSAPAAQVWEYSEVELDTHFLATPKLNQLGTQGWELVGFVSGCIPATDRPLECRYRAYLKRPK
ncbi:MAG TPA: hypothetical protein VF251_12035 [Pyrinomonadaceae bacterium]